VPSPHAPSLQPADLIWIASDLHLDAVLDRATTVAARHTGATGVVLVLRHDRSDPDASGQLGRWQTFGIDDATAVELYASSGDPGPAADPGGTGVPLTRRHHPQTGETVLRVSCATGAHRVADLILAHPSPHGFDAVPTEDLVLLGDVIGVALHNALSYSSSERRREAAELAAAVDQALTPPYSLAEPLTRIAAGGLRIAGARTAAVVSGSEHGVDVAMAAGEHSDELPDLLDGVADLVRAAQGDGEEFSTRVRDHVVWGVPLRPEHAYTGVLVLLLDPASAARTAEERLLVSTFVRHASLVLDHGLLQQERQDAVVAADRDRIARDLHDVVIQQLYATGLKLRASRAGGSSGATDDLVSEAMGDLDVSIRDIRSTIFELERGASASLRGDVAALVREYEPALGFSAVVRTWGPIDSLVGDHQAAQAVVVLREALSNCARHAGAHRCEVEVAVQEGWLSVQVADDGRGPQQGDRPGNGLRNLERRAAELGGHLVLEPAVPRGTCLRWRVPLADQPGSTGSPEAPGEL
jgi:signal transduction histidine kinase